MNKKTYQQLEFEPYVEHGVVKLRYKEPLTKDMFPEEAQNLAEALIKAIGVAEGDHTGCKSISDAGGFDT